MVDAAAELPSLLNAAVARRASLLADSNFEAIRLVHDTADGLDGLVIEKFGPVLIVQHHEGRCRTCAEALRPHVEGLLAMVQCRAAYLKVFSRDRASGEQAHRASHTDPTPWIGAPIDAVFAVREGLIRFLVRPYDGFSVGVFLENRDNRGAIMGLADGRSVLNLFAYTCGFSIAAALGGASRVSSVDLSRRYLEWGKENFVASGVDPERHLFYCSDVLGFFERARRQKLAYDIVLLDPPTFSRLRRPARVFVLAERLTELITGALGLLNPGGHLFFATNHRGLTRMEIERALGLACRRPLRELRWLPLPSDFAGDPEYSKALLARVD